MKKLLVSLLCLLTFGVLNVNADELPEITDHEKVTIYIFRGNGCGYCKNALTYFNDNADKYSDYFEVKTYEVWENSYNNELLKAVAEKMGDTLGGVPYIIIGDAYSENGFADYLAEDMIDAALTEYQNESYKDLVSEVAKDHANAKQQSLREACIEEGIIVEKRDTSKDWIIVAGIFAVIIGGGAALVVLSRKK